MKPLEILAALPKWAKASNDDILSSPAWAMPCRLGSRQCTMRLDAVRPAETLDLAITLESEAHVLGIAPSPAFPELAAVWDSRADVPEPVLLALVEKDCGELLQLLENALRHQLKIAGIARSADGEGARKVYAQISIPDNDAPIVFSLDLSPMVTASLGQLRYIDAAHPDIRGSRAAAEVEYASFALSAADMASIATGDALLLPETDTIPPRIIVDKKFSLSEAGVAAWKDEGLLRVCAAEDSSIDLGAIFDMEAGGSSALPKPPAENAPLRLVQNGKVVATGRFGALAGQRAMFID